MNTGNLLAWLMCLLLAFLACVLSVRNAGGLLRMEKQMEWLQERLDAQRPVEPFSAEIERIRRSLDNVARELAELKEASLPGASPELQAKLAEVQTLLRRVQEQIAASERQDGG